MKKFLLTAFLFSILILNALSQTSTVTVFSQNGEKFWVIVNGIKQNEKPMTNVKVTGLSLPNYRFKILFEDEKIAAIDKNVFTMNSDQASYDETYMLKKDKQGDYVMRLNSSEPVREVVAPEPNQIIVPYTTVERTTNVTTTNTVDNQNFNINVTDPVTGETIKMNMNVPAPGVGFDVNDPSQTNLNTNHGTRDNTYTQTTVTTTTTSTNNYENNDRDRIERDRLDRDRLEKERLENERLERERLERERIEREHHKREHADKDDNEDREKRHPVYIMPGYNGPIGCEYPMAGQDFMDAKNSISSKSFEDSKMTIAKQITEANCLSTAQIKEIITLFSFEDSKLDFAKYAYQHTYDIGNYFKINDAFTFESSINELNEYISTHKKK